MSADIVLTPNARTGPVETHEPGPGLRFQLCSGGQDLNLRPLGYECRIGLTNRLTFHSDAELM